jgi:anti-sigma B factor antagonist
MTITIKQEKSAIVLYLEGRLDRPAGAGLKDEIKRVCNAGAHRIHLNLQKVDFINSSGLGALVTVMKMVTSNKGKVTLSNLASHVREIFEITQLSDVFEIFESEQEALAAAEKVSST